jgi:hypothetical protein
MDVRTLKKIIAKMSDDAEVFARNRDCISLERIDIVNHPAPLKHDDVNYFSDITKVYGGRDAELTNESKQAIIFCDCD